MKNDNVQDPYTQFRLLDENMPDPIARFNRELQFVYANKAFLRNLGLEASDVLGKTNEELGIPAAYEPWLTLLKDVFETGEPAERQGSFTYDGEEVFMVTKVVPERNGQGEVETVLAIGRDVTELKNAEREILRLRDATAQVMSDRYRVLLDNISQGFCVAEVLFDESGATTDYRLLETNRIFEEQTGLFDAIGKTMRELRPAHEESWFRFYGEVVRTGQSAHCELEASAHKSGAWYEVFAYPHGSEGSNELAILFNDITARKHQERQQQFLVELSDVLRSIPEPRQIEEAVTHTTMNFFKADRCYYCEIEGENAIIRRDAFQEGLPSVAGTYPLASFALFKKVIDEKRPFIVYDARTSEILDEPLRELCLQLQVISFVDIPVVKNGKVVGILCLVQSLPRQWTEADVVMANETAERTWAAVERAKAVEALCVNEEKYRTLFENIDEGFCIIEMIYDDTGKAIDWIFLEVNRAFERNNGLRDAVGRTIRELTPDIEPKWMEIYDNVARTGEPLRFEEDSQALERVFSLYAFPIDEPEKRRVAVIFADITDRKVSEELMKHSELRLHQLVNERTEELQRSNEDLSQFTHVASHDLKEPVRKIKTFTNRIISEFGQELPEKMNVYLDKIGKAADRMIAMIEGVLAYSKLEYTGHQSEMVDLELVMTEIASDLELLILQKNARIVTEDLPAVVGSRLLLHQLFYNLVLNSLKFARHNVPSLITIRSKRIEQDGQPFFEIVLSDNGIGFDPVYAERIFTTFTRLHPVDKYEGTGLGLALCKKIVLRHQGTISATAVPDEGATFTVLLPGT